MDGTNWNIVIQHYLQSNQELDIIVERRNIYTGREESEAILCKLFVTLLATKLEGDVSHLPAAHYTNEEYWHFQVHSDEQLLQNHTVLHGRTSWQHIASHSQGKLAFIDARAAYCCTATLEASNFNEEYTVVIGVHRHPRQRIVVL